MLGLRTIKTMAGKNSEQLSTWSVIHVFIETSQEQMGHSELVTHQTVGMIQSFDQEQAG